jgi:hypothetical protein
MNDWTTTRGMRTVRVMAARFPSREAADRALVELRAGLDLGPTDIAVAPLGSADEDDDDGSAYLLAGRFEDSRVPVVRRIVEADDGAIVADVDEVWVRPRTHAGQRNASGEWPHQDGSPPRRDQINN